MMATKSNTGGIQICRQNLYQARERMKSRGSPSEAHVRKPVETNNTQNQCCLGKSKGLTRGMLFGKKQAKEYVAPPLAELCITKICLRKLGHSNSKRLAKLKT
jgi:hypothetical protein